MFKTLDGKVALVTGASKGLGKEIAVELAKNGASVIINYLNDYIGANNVQKKIEEFNGICSIYQCDVSEYLSVREMVSMICRDYNSLDILINNAGIPGPQKKIEDIDPDELVETINTNLVGPFYLTKEVVPIMKKNKWGRIVNIGSIAGQKGEYGLSAYSVSKSGLYGLTKSVSLELARHNTTINLICPGYIDAGITKKPEITSDKLREILTQRIPSRKLGEASDISKAVLFIVSEDAKYINGQIININGGAY